MIIKKTFVHLSILLAPLTAVSGLDDTTDESSRPVQAVEVTDLTGYEILEPESMTTIDLEANEDVVQQSSERCVPSRPMQHVLMATPPVLGIIFILIWLAATGG